MVHQAKRQGELPGLLRVEINQGAIPKEEPSAAFHRIMAILHQTTQQAKDQFCPRIVSPA
jgi:hypothetical protein